jgi:hypothetical protein
MVRADSCSNQIFTHFLLLSAMLTLRGSKLHNENIISSAKFRPLASTVTFNIHAPDVSVDLTLPKWSTHRVLFGESANRLGMIGLLQLEGSYFYYADRRIDNIDRLKLHFKVIALGLTRMK